MTYCLFSFLHYTEPSAQATKSWGDMTDLQVVTLAVSLCQPLLRFYLFFPVDLQVPEEKDKLGHRDNDMPWCASNQQQTEKQPEHSMVHHPATGLTEEAPDLLEAVDFLAIAAVICVTDWSHWI